MGWKWGGGSILVSCLLNMWRGGGWLVSLSEAMPAVLLIFSNHILQDRVCVLLDSVYGRFRDDLYIDQIQKSARSPLLSLSCRILRRSPSSSAQIRNSDPNRHFHDVAVALSAKTLFTLSRVIVSPPGEPDVPDIPCLRTHIASIA